MIQIIKRHKRQLILFFIAGVISAVIEICLMKLLSLPNMLPSVFSFESQKSYPLSNILSTAGGIMSNYFLSIHYVFERGKHSKRKEFSLFIIFSLLTMIFSYGFFALLHSYVNKPIKILFITVGDIVFCKAVAIFIISIINYVLKKKIVFSS